MFKTDFIRQRHQISSLTSPFTLNGAGFRICICKKAADKADTLQVIGTLLHSNIEQTFIVNADQRFTQEIFKEIKTVVLTNHDLYWGTEYGVINNVVFTPGAGILAASIDQHVGWGELATEPTVGLPTRSGWTFNKWMLGEFEYSFATPVVAPITLVASYLENICTVTFDSAGGTAIAAQQVENGETATTPDPAPTKAGYTFDKWLSGESEFNFATPITADITLTATWLENFTVTFDSEGGSAVTAQEVADGSTATEPTDPTLAAHIFNFWSLTEGGSEYNFATAVTEDITLYAVWIEVFPVTFDSQGGTAVTTQQVPDGEIATEPTPAPTYEAHTFQHWSLTTDGTAYSFATPITAATTLYAIWVAN